jgi:hypothetical protein
VALVRTAADEIATILFLIVRNEGTNNLHNFADLVTSGFGPDVAR